MDKPLVSIILPSFRRSELLDFGLFSLSKQKTSFPFEIIVLNDGVLDDTERVCSKYENVKYIFTGSRNLDGEIKWRVPGYAINIGVKQSSGDILVLSNPEIWHLLENNLEVAVQSCINNNLTISVPTLINFDDDRHILSYLLNSNYNNSSLGIPNDIFNLGCPETPKSKMASGMPFFFTMPKSYFMGIGGYDEDFTGYAGDDNDFVGRLKYKGLIVHRINELKVIHLYHEGTNNGMNHEDNPAWVHNYTLWKTRKGIIERNVGREWGVL
jgi:glycosyltransferase involved in cell wall biosynthesis